MTRPTLKKMSIYLHISVLIFTAGMAWQSVSANNARIDKLEIKQENLSEVIADIRTANARIEQKVDDIRGALNIRHR